MNIRKLLTFLTKNRENCKKLRYRAWYFQLTALQQQPFSLTFMFLTFSKYIDFSNVFSSFSTNFQTFHVKIVRKINTFLQLFVTFDVKNVRKTNVFLRQFSTDFPHLVPSRSPNLPFFPSFHFSCFTWSLALSYGPARQRHSKVVAGLGNKFIKEIIDFENFFTAGMQNLDI